MNPKYNDIKTFKLVSEHIRINGKEWNSLRISTRRAIARLVVDRVALQALRAVGRAMRELEKIKS